MAEIYDLVLRGGTVVSHDGIAPTEIGIRDGRIAEIGPIDRNSAGRTIDVTGLHILPGVIDSQVHFREPGGEHKEDLASGSQAAVLGGVTTVFEMPNTDPLTTSAAALADKLTRARGRMWCDHAFYVGGTVENVNDIPELERLPGSAGIKVFMGSSTGDLLIDNEAGLAAILSKISRRAAFHAEDEARLKARAGLRIEGDPASHPVWRDPEAALMATRRLVRMAEAAGKRIHVLHISTAEEIKFLAGHKRLVTCEATPQHLSLTAPGAYADHGTHAQMNPPVRDAANMAAIWRGVKSGIIDVLGSDHAPHTLEEKARPYPASPSGMPGVQTLVPLMLSHVNAGRMSLQRFVDLTAHGPQRIFGIAGKGRIAVGYDADFTIVDLKRRQTISPDWLVSRAGWSPFSGLEVTGWPVGTIIRGNPVMWEGELQGRPSGVPVVFDQARPV
ncbi:MAG: dihydroorotase [Hyphomicrobiales bacterium]